jgi:hypothetical protein
MKLVKMSLAAAMLMGASAYADADVNVYGSAKLIYQTTDNSSVDLFDQDGARGQAGVELGANIKASDAITVNVEMAAMDTLGLENNLVDNVMAGWKEHDQTNSSVSEIVATQWWASQANLTAKLGNTTAVIGRQELNTPLVFTEKWNAGKNTFDAGVLVNGDIPNTTLVAAWVGKDNGATGFSTVVNDGEFKAFGDGDGAYAFGAVFSGVKDLTLQGWYYDVISYADAYWLQADGKVAMGDGMALSYGVQIAGAEGEGAIAAADGFAYAAKVGFDVAGVHMFGAYSDVDDGGIGFANVATGDKTKLYTGTASIFADGAVTAASDSETFKLGVGTKAGSVGLKANYTNVSNDSNAAVDGDAWDISAATKIAGIGLKAIYTQETFGAADTDALRVILSTKF